MDARQRGAEMLQKGQVQPVFSRTSTASMAFSDGSDLETEFEDDMSDFDDYAGRRSEDSVRSCSIPPCHVGSLTFVF